VRILEEIDALHLEQIVAIEGAANPLLLKVVLSELRVFGSFAGLADKIRSDFGDSPVSAFTGTLRRLEDDSAYSPILPMDAVPLLLENPSFEPYIRQRIPQPGRRASDQCLQPGGMAELAVSGSGSVSLFQR